MRSRLCLGLLLYLATLDSTGAWASDIECPAARLRTGRVVCDNASINGEYADIIARGLVPSSSGKRPSKQLAQSRQLQNARTGADCAAPVVLQWKITTNLIAATSTAARARGKAFSPDFAAGPRFDADVLTLRGNARYASVALRASEASLIRQDNEARVALPQPAASHARLPRVTPSASSQDRATREMWPTAGMVALVVIVISLSVFVVRRNKSLGITTNYRRVRGKKRR